MHAHAENFKPQPPFHYWLLWSAVLILMAFNAGLIVVLFSLKNQAADAALQAANILRQAQTQSLSAPIAVSVAVDDTFSFPVKTVVPIKTTINVPVVIPIIGQTVTLKVPIDTAVPINTTVRIPVKKSVPINIKISDTPFSGVLRQWQDWLAALAIRLGAGER